MRLRAVTVAACAVLAAACGSTAPASHTSATAAAHPSSPPVNHGAVPDGDWSRFDYDAQRDGVDPAGTGINRGNLGSLRARVVQINGIADSSAVQIHGVRIKGRVRDVIVLNTIYGQAIALDPATGARLWEFTPRSTRSLQGGHQIAQATPVVDPDGSFVYTLSPDGYVHKLSITSGHQVWATRLTFDAYREKMDTVNFAGDEVLVATGGYDGDTPSYQGKVVSVNPANGHIINVWNSLCSNRHRLLDPPSSCPASDSAIWARAGVVVEPGSGRLLVATGNAPFNGSTDWGDSVLELTPNASRLLHNWTPRNEVQLNDDDGDLGSTAPALLPGGLAVQGGKAGVLSLLSLNRLDGTAHGAGKRLGGELQDISTPGGGQLLTAPAVWSHGGKTYVFVADDSGTTAYVLRNRRLHVDWQDGTAGTSPVIGGGLLYIYDEQDGLLKVRNPVSGIQLASLQTATGHWNSPIVIGGRIILPTGNGDSQGTSSNVYIWHLPGR
jgi:outer membrane protein assembly factor BamB